MTTLRDIRCNEAIIANGINVIIYQPEFKDDFYNSKVIIHEFDIFKELADFIICNRISTEPFDVMEQVYSHDLFGCD